MFKDINSAPRIFKDPRITSNGKYRYRLVEVCVFVCVIERVYVCILACIDISRLTLYGDL